MAGQQLPSSFYERMEVYLKAYKNKFAKEKKRGNVEEYSTDPIPLPVYHLLLWRSIEESNVLHGCGLCCNGTAWPRVL